MRLRKGNSWLLVSLRFNLSLAPESALFMNNDDDTDVTDDNGKVIIVYTEGALIKCQACSKQFMHILSLLKIKFL